mgnify:CR=1 FL=1
MALGKILESVLTMRLGKFKRTRREREKEREEGVRRRKGNEGEEEREGAFSLINHLENFGRHTFSASWPHGFTSHRAPSDIIILSRNQKS